MQSRSEISNPTSTRSRYLSAALLLICICSTALAQEAVHQAQDDAATGKSAEPAWSHVGLLRARDLSPFGLLRLDMLPAHTADALEDKWTFELQMAYQNTFILSENTRQYLEQRNIGRQPLRPQDAAAILALPGDAYYVDGEVGLYDLIVQRRISPSWSAYVTLSYIRYGEGVLDSTVESFHSIFGLGQQGRTLVAKNHFQVVYDIGDTSFTQLDRETKGGFGDPVIGIRYSLPEPRFGWDVVVEFATKIAVDGERFLLSTGRDDYGTQITLQRRLGKTGRHAIYLSGSAVYYSGGPEMPDEDAQMIPTLIAGYSFGVTPRTSVILQGYVSRSVVQDTTINQLKDDKYLLSLGLQSRSRNFLWSLALTENVKNFENTPDISAQLGFAYMPRAK